MLVYSKLLDGHLDPSFLSDCEGQVSREREIGAIGALEREKFRFGSLCVCALRSSVSVRWPGGVLTWGANFSIPVPERSLTREYRLAQGKSANGRCE